MISGNIHRRNSRPTGLTISHARHLRRQHRVVRIHSAHSWLQDLRSTLTHDSATDHEWTFRAETTDLTDGSMFDWKGYVANHSDPWLLQLFEKDSTSRHCRTILKFEARFLNIWIEEITPGCRQRLLSFVAYGNDDVHFRWVPGSSGADENWPVQGHVQNWLICPALAATNSIADAGIAFMIERVRLWETNNLGSFTLNLTDKCMFDWERFMLQVLFNDPDGTAPWQHTNTRCWLVWIGRSWQMPGFYLATTDGLEQLFWYDNNTRLWHHGHAGIRYIHWRC